MDKARLLALVLFLPIAVAHSAQIIKLTSDPRVVGVSPDSEVSYELGETLCFERSGSTSGCGTVTRIFNNGAAVELNSDANVLLGDQVVSRGTSETASYGTTTRSHASTESVSRGKTGLIGNVHLGFNYPDYTTTSSSYSKLFSYLIGIGAEIPLSQALSIEPGLFYSPEWVSSSSSTVTAKVSVTYLEIPLFLKIKPFYRSATKYSPYLLLGPSYGYLVSARLTYEGIDTPETDFTSLLNSSRISFNAALGLETNLSDDLTIGFSLRYLLSITSPARTSSSSSARLLQGVVTLSWDYEDEEFYD